MNVPNRSYTLMLSSQLFFTFTYYHNKTKVPILMNQDVLYLNNLNKSSGIKRRKMCMIKMLSYQVVTCFIQFWLIRGIFMFTNYAVTYLILVEYFWFLAPQTE